MLSVAKPGVKKWVSFIPSVAIDIRYAESRYAECQYDGLRYALIVLNVVNTECRDALL